MKKYCLFLAVVLCMFVLTSCCVINKDSPDCQPQRPDVSKETWIYHLGSYLNTNRWLRNADCWFLNGRPDDIAHFKAYGASYPSERLSRIKVSHFSEIQTAGNFKVQIVDDAEPCTVYVLGPLNEVRQVFVAVRDHTLILAPIHDTKISLHHVTIRVNVHNLHRIVHNGNGLIAGRFICSDDLTILSQGNGNIFLVGRMNLHEVKQVGAGGTITLLGVNSSLLDVIVYGNGNVNIGGRFNLRSVIHKGNCDVNLNGAKSNCLTVETAGNGTTVIGGYVNLKRLIARGQSKVYINMVTANETYVTQRDISRVGLAGMTNLNLDTYNYAIFEGQFLRSGMGYARTRDHSHASVTADKELFAGSMDNSRIFIYGPQSHVSSVTSQNGTIIPFEYVSTRTVSTKKAVEWNDPRWFTPN